MPAEVGRAVGAAVSIFTFSIGADRAGLRVRRVLRGKLEAERSREGA